MRAPSRRNGKSVAVFLPQRLFASLGVSAGASLFVSLRQGRVIISPVKVRPRHGWAKAAKELTLAGDDRLVWRTSEEW
jgi:antitoxin component of MazEF toxin-antitoxin module